MTFGVNGFNYYRKMHNKDSEIGHLKIENRELKEKIKELEDEIKRLEGIMETDGY